MRCIIAGGRLKKPECTVYGLPLQTIYDFIDQAVRESGFTITEGVCGMATGVDLLGRCWCRDHGIPYKEFPADWSQGKAGGMIRNRQMAEYAEALIAIWDGESKGTANMIATARKLGLKVYVQHVQPGVVSV